MTGERKSSHTLAGGGLADHRLGDTRRMVPRPSCSPRQPCRAPSGSTQPPGQPACSQPSPALTAEAAYSISIAERAGLVVPSN